MAEVDFGLIQLFSPTLCKCRLSWIRHESISKKAQRRREKQNLTKNGKTNVKKK
jgi:hypothetical protein